MIPVDSQFKEHDPDNAEIGDCLRACIASLLELSIDDVPHFARDSYPDWEKTNKQLNKWLAERELVMIDLPIRWPDDHSIESMLSWVASCNPDVYYKLSGKSQRGFSHCVICYNDEVVHDPTYGSPHGIVGPVDDDGTYWLSFLASGWMLKR